MYRLWHHITLPILEILAPKHIVGIRVESIFDTKNLLNYAKRNRSVTHAIDIIDPVPSSDLNELLDREPEILCLHSDTSLNTLPNVLPADIVLLNGNCNCYTVYKELSTILKVSDQKSCNYPIIMLHNVTTPFEKESVVFDDELTQPISQNCALIAIDDFINEHDTRFECCYIEGFNGLCILFEKKFFEQRSDFAEFINSTIPTIPIKGQLEALEQNRIKELLNLDELKQKLSDEKLLNTSLSKTLIEHKTLHERLKREQIEISKESSLLYSKLKHSEKMLNVQRLKLELHNLEQQRIELANTHLNVSNALKVKSAWLTELTNHYTKTVNSLGWRAAGLVTNKILAKIRQPSANAQAPFQAAQIIRDFQNWMESSQNPNKLAPFALKANFTSVEIEASLSSDTIVKLQKKLSIEVVKTNILISTNATLEIWLHQLLGALESMYASLRFRLGKWLVDYCVNKPLRRNAYLVILPYTTAQVRCAFSGYSSANVIINNIETNNTDSSKKTSETVGKSNESKPNKSNKHSDLIETNNIESTRASAQIIQYIPSNPQNPYYTIIPRDLTNLGWNIKYEYKPDRVEALLANANNQKTIIHFHQLEPYYHSKTGDVEETKILAQQLIKQIKYFRKLGARIVWTNHNPLPHDRTFQEIDEKLIGNVSPLIDEIVVLGRNAKAAFNRYWGHAHISVVHHPSYQLQYGPKIAKAIARDVINIPEDAFLFGHIGHIKPYKGLETIIKSFEIAKQKIKKDCRLLIAGKSDSPEYVSELLESLPHGVTLMADLIPDDTISTFVSALDASVFAFRDIWASSSVVLSLSYGAPVLAPNLGCMPEYISHNNNGLLYRHNDIHDLADKMVEIATNTDYAEHYSYMCQWFNRNFSVAHAAQEFEKIYHRVANA